jgi:hypothetical protein
VTTLPRDPLTDTHRLLIDGSNLLHALSRRRPTSSGSAGQTVPDGPKTMPAAALIGRIRGIIPPSIGIELIFDGMPDRGMRGERVAAGLIVRHSGRRTADELLLSLVDEARGVAGAEAAAGLLVVSDDRALRNALHLRGARTAGCTWLLGRLDRPKLAAPSVGNRRPPKPSGAGSSAHGSDDEDRVGWTPGRGATRKRGNPHRGKPSSGTMRS